VDVDCDSLGLLPEQDMMSIKNIRWSDEFTVGTNAYHILIFDPYMMHSWPGSQPITLVVTELDYRVLCWSESGGSPMFASGQLQLTKGQHILSVFSRNRQGGTLVERFEINPRKINKLSSTLERNLSTGGGMGQWLSED